MYFILYGDLDKLTCTVTFSPLCSPVMLEVEKSNGKQYIPSPSSWAYVLTWLKLLKDVGLAAVEIRTPT